MRFIALHSTDGDLKIIRRHDDEKKKNQNLRAHIDKMACSVQLFRKDRDNMLRTSLLGKILPLRELNSNYHEGDFCIINTRQNNKNYSFYCSFDFFFIFIYRCN